MAYSDYSFYTAMFYGNLIPDDSYAKYSDKAYDKLNMITYDNITEETMLDESLAKKVKKAECAIAEMLYELDQINSASGVDASGKGKIVKSESAGSVSKSYDVSKSVVENTVTSINDIDKSVYTVIKGYLYNTGLLYAGL